MVSTGKLLNDNIYKKRKKMMLIHISYLVVELLIFPSGQQ